ncbi:MAG: branched-chain amino acid ABC transporter permease [Candidatus Bathyarchaeia archaeon]
MLDILIGGAILGAIFTLVSIGLNLQYGVTRILNIAHGDFMVLGAYLTYVFVQSLSLSPLAAMVIGAPLVFLLGVIIQLAIFRWLVRLSKSAEELEFRSLLACFGLSFIIQNVLYQIFGPYPIGNPCLDQAINVMGQPCRLNMIVAAGISIAISLALYFLLRYTRIGLIMRATVEEPTGAQIVGINIYKVHALSFGLGAFLSALAGSLWSTIYLDIYPYSGATFTFIALTIIVLGGMGSFMGSLAGGFILGYLYYITYKFEPLLHMAVVYIFLLIMLIVRPKGLFGR